MTEFNSRATNNLQSKIEMLFDLPPVELQTLCSMIEQDHPSFVRWLHDNFDQRHVEVFRACREAAASELRNAVSALPSHASDRIWIEEFRDRVLSPTVTGLRERSAGKIAAQLVAGLLFLVVEDDAELSGEERSLRRRFDECGLRDDYAKHLCRLIDRRRSITGDLSLHIRQTLLSHIISAGQRNPHVEDAALTVLAHSLTSSDVEQLEGQLRREADEETCGDDRIWKFGYTIISAK